MCHRGHINDRNKNINIKVDKKFVRSRQVIAIRRKNLSYLGKGNKPNATGALTDKKIDKYYDHEYFGTKNYLSLKRTMWWKITTCFGYRAKDESRILKFEDIKKGIDSNRSRFL